MKFPARSRLSSVLFVVAALGLLSGCGGAPERIDASGIDELVIPTPHPTATDFVAEIDHPLLPLQPGAAWVYEDTGPDGNASVTVTVLEETKVIQGVRTTVLHREVRDHTGEVLEDAYDCFAQDRRGNVWYFGEATTQGSWQAGVDGAVAGLVMAAVPRVGDGYQQEFRLGVAEDRARVVALDGVATVPAGEFVDLLVTEESTPLEPGLAALKYYARGIGLVLEESSRGPAKRRELVSYTAP